MTAAPVPPFGGGWLDPGPLPAEITAPQFLVGVQRGWHAIDPASIAFQGGPHGCLTHAAALCGYVVRVARGELQPYRPGEPPVSHDQCPACRWTVAARTGTLAAAVAELADPLAVDVACAILDKACRDLLENEHLELDDPALIQLLAHVSRHEPGRIVGEECAEGSCGHPEGQCPGRDACRACSLQAGSWAGEREGQFRDECTILSPCGPLLAAAAHFGVEATADGAARIAAGRRRQVAVEGWAPAHDAEHQQGQLAAAAACYATPPQHRHISAMNGSPLDWPWHPDWWKPGDRARELEKAGALIAAELDRIAAAGGTR